MSSPSGVPYTHERLLTVTLCEETGDQMKDAVCPTHGGDACLYVYAHPSVDARAQTLRMNGVPEAAIAGLLGIRNSEDR